MFMTYAIWQVLRNSTLISNDVEQFNDILGKHLTQLEIELKWLQCFIRVTFIYV